MKPYLYIDTDFYEFLIETLNKGFSSDDFDALYKIRKFILNQNVNVVLNYEKNPENNFLNDLVRVKGMQAVENNGSITLELKNTSEFENEVIKIGSKSPFSICFSTRDNVDLKESVHRSGYHFIDTGSIKDFLSLPFISQKNVFGVNKSRDISSWKDLKKLSHNFNTLIILDRFLFSRNVKSTHSKFRETISELIANLLHRNSASEIDVLLVSVKNPYGDVGLSLKEIREAIEMEMKKMNISRKINISIARCKQITDDNHDRLIFTNLCAMSSANSFNYFENRTIKNKPPTINTTLSTYCFLDLENWETYFQMLKSRKNELPTKEDLNIPNEDLVAGNINIEFIKLL